MTQQTKSGSSTPPPIAELMATSGLGNLPEGISADQLRQTLHAFAGALIQTGADELYRLAARDEAIAAVRRAGFRTATKLVDAAIKVVDASGRQDTAGVELGIEDPEPWPDPVDGGLLLQRLERLLECYLVLPAGASVVMAAWIMATWCVGHLKIAPILAALSPTKECGKSLLLDILSFVVKRPMLGFGMRPAVLFRAVDQFRPTLLWDEAERLSARASGETDELIAVVNGGYRHGGKVYRCVGDNHDIKAFDPFGFRAVAAIGILHDTIIGRSVVIPMIRAFEHRDGDHLTLVDKEGVPRQVFIYEQAKSRTGDLRRQLARWANDFAVAVANGVIDAPRFAFLGHRGSDNFAALFSVAAIAGPETLERLVDGARELAKERTMRDVDPAELLIHDLKRVWEAHQPRSDALAAGKVVGYQRDEAVQAENPEIDSEVDYLTGYQICSSLNAMHDRAWSDWNGRGLHPAGLAALLRPFGVYPKEFRPGGGRPKVRAYQLSALTALWARYPEGEEAA